MNIELHGVGFVNKGAELMLLAVLEQVRNRFPSAVVAMSPNLRHPAREQRAALGLRTKIYLPQFYYLPWQLIGRLIPRRMRQFFGLVAEHEIDVFLDASGFALGDAFLTLGNKRFASAVRCSRRSGRKVILLPQAFGPFRDPQKKELFAAIVRAADLVFARDPISLQYSREVVGENQKLELAPDFTCLLKGEIPDEFSHLSGRFCVIPNCRMIDKSSSGDGEKYLPFLVRCLAYLLERGAEPYVLVHEGEQDRLLAEEAIRQLPEPVDLVTVDNPLSIKGIIGTSSGLLGSRFHGLVSALSQGVPALATGWSHKYAMLFDDYDFPQGLLSVAAAPDEIAAKIDSILDPDSAVRIRASLERYAAVNRKRSEEMWSQVFQTIAGEPSG